MRLWVRHVWHVGIAATVAVVATAPPAAAHGSAGKSATNWRSEVTGITIVDSGARATTTDLGDHVEVTADGSHQIIVFGYNGEPYLKFDAQGVSINGNSPAVFINRSTTHSKKVPPRFDAKAAPQWRRETTARSYSWHDHRFHRGPGGTPRAWTIPISVDGAPAKIAGRLLYVDPTAPSTALFVGVAAVGFLSAFAMLRRRAMTIVSALAVLVCATAILVSQQRFSTEPWQDQLGATAYSLGTILSATAVLTVGLARRRNLAAPVVLLASVAILVCGGFARFDWLTRSQLPSTLPYEVATSFVMLTMVIAGVLGAFAIIDLIQPTDDTADDKA